jgi:hypothetical protein
VLLDKEVVNVMVYLYQDSVASMKRYSNDILSMFWSNIEHGKAVMTEFCKSDDEDSDNDDDDEESDSFYDPKAISPSNDNEEAEANGGPDDCYSLEDFIVDEGDDLNEEDDAEEGEVEEEEDD